MSDELAVAETIGMPEKTFHLIARSPQEMQAAQTDLIEWLHAKVKECKQEVSDLKTATETAIQNKWASKPLATQLAKARQRQMYYGKLLHACIAGYCIVPNFPIDVFAIRITRNKPAVAMAQTTCSYREAEQDLTDERPDIRDIGAGRYVSPRQTVERWQHTSKDDKGNEQITKYAQPVGFDEIIFPLVAAQPVVMDATATAMALRLFDRIGICPQTQPNGDPLIIGQIMMSTRNGYSEPKMVSFLIAWHLNLKTL